jgi:murein DD-endopeptidase MepM/ murein hydrolase activator NlpD
MIFPNLKNRVFGYLDLNLEAKEWFKQKNIDLSEKNILINPDKCEEFVNDIHKKYSLDFSYGGWMEDRSFLWRDWYLDKEQLFIHLAVDLNVPTGTEVATDFDAEVAKIDNDFPLDGGWGTYIILKHLSKSVYVLYAHLDENILCKVGDKLNKDTIFAKVGHAPQNGNWFPHTHVQIINADYYLELEKNNGWEKFDGYGLKNDIEMNAKKHPDPMQFISLY